jgi:hypothetical protein
VSGEKEALGMSEEEEEPPVDVEEEEEPPPTSPPSHPNRRREEERSCSREKQISHNDLRPASSQAPSAC